jgi:hypothetical protein
VVRASNGIGNGLGFNHSQIKCIDNLGRAGLVTFNKKQKTKNLFIQVQSCHAFNTQSLRDVCHFSKQSLVIFFIGSLTSTTTLWSAETI